MLGVTSGRGGSGSSTGSHVSECLARHVDFARKWPVTNAELRVLAIHGLEKARKVNNTKKAFKVLKSPYRHEPQKRHIYRHEK